ncbi:MAG: hypothetical protein GY854_30765 [Deltaproteobacteria bacterium]|nr:hypothetical protein [Deltaproteobacteria bacterium]
MSFSQTFWKNEGRTVEQKPQNPIAGKQALYNKDQRPQKVSLAQGMVFNDRDRVRVYDSQKNVWFDSVDEAMRAGCDEKKIEIFTNKEGKIFHSPAVFVAERRALESFKEEQFGENPSQNPTAYGTPTLPPLVEAMTLDGEDIYGEGKYDKEKTISFQTLGMASGYKHLLLPLMKSVRGSVGLPAIENIVMGSNFYGAYPATFDEQKIHRYRYMNENGDFDFEAFEKAAHLFDPKTTMFLFDMSTGNNYIGTKRTKEDNEKIAAVLIDKQFYSEHDIAYPNFSSEFNSEDELYRILQRAGAPHGVQSSRGKKDKYASRLAFHHVYLGVGDQRAEIFSHLVSENRSRFLALPKNWGYLVELARDPSLRAAHRADERAFVSIVNDSRKNLADKLGWDWMRNRAGMFDKVDINHEGIENMGEEYAIYAVPSRNQNLVGKNGLTVEVTRIKHGIPVSKIQNVADALSNAMEKYPSESGSANPDIIC